MEGEDSEGEKTSWKKEKQSQSIIFPTSLFPLLIAYSTIPLSSSSRTAARVMFLTPHSPAQNLSLAPTKKSKLLELVVSSLPLLHHCFSSTQALQSLHVLSLLTGRSLHSPPVSPVPGLLLFTRRPRPEYPFLQGDEALPVVQDTVPALWQHWTRGTSSDCRRCDSHAYRVHFCNTGTSRGLAHRKCSDIFVE